MPTTTPSITNPVMRFVGVSDPARAAAFYRDILGFEIRSQEGATEAHHGPARLRFGAHGYPPDNWDTPLEPGAAMLFFQAGDVAAMRAAIEARGGRPGGIQKVNWIKMRMFEIRDPDGNVLWFGQTYAEPETPPEKPPLLRQALPELPVDNVAAAVDYYVRILGFRINYQQHDLGVMDRDAITILLIARTGRHTGIGSFEVYIEDADALHAELTAKGANVLGPPVSYPWGLRTFQVLDPEGNRITFAQTFE